MCPLFVRSHLGRGVSCKCASELFVQRSMLHPIICSHLFLLAIVIYEKLCTALYPEGRARSHLLFRLVHEFIHIP